MDANVLLAYIDGDSDRIGVVAELFRQARAGDIELVTSVLTQTEVAYGASEGESGRLDAEVEAKIDELWKPASPLKMVELSPAVAQEARAIIRAEFADGRSGLKPPDAIHLATAKRMAVAAFYTYDKPLQRHRPSVSFPITEPIIQQAQFPGT
ncbi:MAG: type II toxin-antitoxin system VapC family toxin [Actinomycetota bacterium]|nr:type II toxin-antitoxin system VapC family toxin [Actinomycetota bacterium]